MLSKGMVARASWTSEASQAVPWSRRQLVQGRSLYTTLSPYELHNARADILIPFYNME